MTRNYHAETADSITALARRIMMTNLCKEIVYPASFYEPFVSLNAVKNIKMPPKSKYQFSRAKWYTASLNGNATWRFSDEYNDIIAWCTEMFGAHPAKHDAWSRWHVGLGCVNFRDEKDYQWFVLRWGA